VGCPITLTEARYVGPWEVVRHGKGWAVRRERDAEPQAVTEFRETACMLAAVIPAAGREPIYDFKDNEVHTSFGDRGFSAIARLEGAVDVEVIRPLHVVHCLLVDPESLAWLLMAAPATTLERTGEVLARKLGERLGSAESKSR
jgi:hypothetical protein